MSYKTSTRKTVLFFVSLLVVFICISLLTVLGFMQSSLPLLGKANSLWSFASDITSATLGIAVAVSGAFVAIIIAQRTVDISAGASKREAQNYVFQRLTTDLKSVKSLQVSIESILFKSEIANDLIENSDILMMIENSFSISDKNEDGKQTLEKCDDGLNLTAIKNFFYHSDEGKTLNASLSKLLEEVSDVLINLADNIDDLCDSDPVVHAWKNGLNKYYAKTSNEDDARTVKGLIAHHVPLIKHNDTISIELTRELFYSLSSLLRKNAIKLKNNTRESLHMNSVLLPLLTIVNNVYKYKLLRHQEILDDQADSKLILQALDFLPLSIFIGQDYVENKHSVLNIGGSALSLIYLVSRVCHTEQQSEGKAFVEMYAEEIPEIEEKEINTLHRLIADHIANHDTFVQRVLKYYLIDFVEKADPALFYTDVMDKSINKNILHERQLEKKPQIRDLILSKTLDFFETYPPEIKGIKVTADLLGDGDCFEPLYVYWLNRNNMSFNGFKKSESSLLFFVYGNDESGNYIYSEKDIEHIESLLSLLYEIYWDEDENVLDLSPIVVGARAILGIFSNDGDEIPMVALEGIIDGQIGKGYLSMDSD